MVTDADADGEVMTARVAAIVRFFLKFIIYIFGTVITIAIPHRRSRL